MRHFLGVLHIWPRHASARHQPTAHSERLHREADLVIEATESELGVRVHRRCVGQRRHGFSLPATRWPRLGGPAWGGLMAGVKYDVASGDEIPNIGEKLIPVMTLEGSYRGVRPRQRAPS